MRRRLLGAIEARQTVQGKTFRNDRLVATAVRRFDYAGLSDLRKLNRDVLKQIKLFFASYNLAQGRRFQALRDSGPDRARRPLRAALLLGGRTGICPIR